MGRLLTVLLIIYSSQSFAWGDESYDIALVDSGLARTFSGLLQMEKTTLSFKSFGPTGYKHGTQMALSMKDQAERDRTQPIKGLQLPYTNSDDYTGALAKAIETKPLVLSLSVQGMFEEPNEKMLLEKACQSGILVVVASGNFRKQLNSFPASYDLPCLVSVSSLRSNVIPSFANDGDIYVPTYFENESGTSYSAARAAVIGLELRRKYPKLSPHKIKLLLTKLYPKPPERNLKAAAVPPITGKGFRSESRFYSRIRR